MTFKLIQISYDHTQNHPFSRKYMYVWLYYEFMTVTLGERMALRAKVYGSSLEAPLDWKDWSREYDRGRTFIKVANMELIYAFTESAHWALITPPPLSLSLKSAYKAV